MGKDRHVALASRPVALTGVAQRSGSHPSQPTAWASGPVPGWGLVRGNQSMFLLFHSLPLSLKINK